MKYIVAVTFLTAFLLTTFFRSANGSALLDEIGFISSILGIVGTFWQPFSDSGPPLDGKFAELLSAINKIQVSDRLFNVEKEVRGIYEYVPQYTNYIRQLHIHENRINDIDAQYSISLKIAENLAKKIELNPEDEKLILQDREKYLSTSHDSLSDTVSTIYNTFIKNGSSTLKYLKKTMQQRNISSCSEADTLQSDQQSLQNLITSIVVAQVKVHLSVKMAASYIKERTGHYPIESSKILLSRLNDQYVDTVELYKNLMPYASRDVWACDPEPHVEDVTFMKLQNVFQKQIVDKDNWIDPMNIYRPGKSYQATDIYRDERRYPRHGYSIWFKNLFTNVVEHWTFESQRLISNGRICQGSIWDCEPLDQLFEGKKGNAFVICHSERNSTRRFERIEAQYVDPDYERTRKTPDILQVIGSKKPCDTRKHAITPVGSSPVCTCDETGEFDFVQPSLTSSGYSHRFFYNIPVVAEEPENATDPGNYVVTGARIGQYKGVFYPIIQQGRVLKNGVIDPHSLRWIDHGKHPEFRPNFNNPLNLEKLAWNDRTIKLGDVDLPPNKVLKGLVFTRRSIFENTRAILRLVPIWRYYDYTSGTVTKKVANYVYGEMYSDEYGNNGTERYIKYHDDVVENVNKLPNLNVKSNMIVTHGYVSFTTSDFLTDLGSTTVPYFDTQKVTTRVPSPMSGVGLYYKYRSGAGGFIGIKLKTYDISQHIQDPSVSLSESAKRIFNEKSSLTDGSIGMYLE